MDILIADDWPILRRGLEQIINGRRGWRVAAEVAAADDVLPVLRSRPIDVVVLSVAFEGRGGIDLLGNIRSEFPALPVLMLSDHDRTHAILALRAGASGLLRKDASPEELLDAIERVSAGEIAVTPDLASELAKKLLHGGALPHETLSAREFEVLRSIASGKSPSVIAGSLHVSAKTVSTYRSRIFHKMGIRTNVELVTYALEYGLINKH